MQAKGVFISTVCTTTHTIDLCSALVQKPAIFWLSVVMPARRTALQRMQLVVLSHGVVWGLVFYVSD